MNELEQRLKQAELDKEGIENNINYLKEQINKAKMPKPRNGDIVEHFGNKRYIFMKDGRWISFCEGGVAESRNNFILYFYHHGAYKVIGNVFD